MAGAGTAGRPPRNSRSRTPICGKRWSRRPRATRSLGNGSRAMPAIPTTSAPTGSPAMRRSLPAGGSQAFRRSGLFDRGAGAVLQHRGDRVAGARLAIIAFGPEDRFGIVFELGDIFALLV